MKNGLNILVCGSQKFNDETFVFETLETFWEQTNCNIETITTSKFSGACQYAEKWVQIKNESLSDENKINLKFYVFDEHLAEKNQSLYENLDIPLTVLENDPFFVKGKELMQKHDIKLVMAFPNKEGILGSSTVNISRFAKLSGAKVLDCSQLLGFINKHRSEIKEKNENTSATPFTNRNKSKIKA